MAHAESAGDVVVVTVTTPEEELAEQLARRLVADRLVACAQVGGPIRSTYRWQGAVEVDREWLLTAKTVAGRLAELVALVGELHPYDVPEVVAVPVRGGDPAYLEWVRTETV